MAIELIDKIKQKNNGNFKLVDAIDVELKDGSDLQNFIDNINDIDAYAEKLRRTYEGVCGK